jgi:DNA-binding MarR family transcriptional regulator
MNRPDDPQEALSALRSQASALEAKRLGDTLVKLGRLVFQRTIERLRERGYPELRMGFTTLLPHLDRTHGTRVTVLAERMGVTKQAAGQMVKQLEEAGHVSRQPDPADGRASLVSLTASGFEVLLAGLEVFAELETELEQVLGTTQMNDFKDAAQTSLAALEALNSPKPQGTHHA